jgi:hypothetical protein
MGQSREQMLAIRTDLGLTGLHRTRSSAVSEETSLRKAENAATDYRGVLRKKGVFKPQSTSIIEPREASPINFESLAVALEADRQHWEKVSVITDNVAVEPGNGGISVFAAANKHVSAGEYIIRRSLREGEEYNDFADWGGNFTLFFTIRAASLFPIAMSNLSTPGLHISAAVSEDMLVTVGLGSPGLYIYNASMSLYAPVPNSGAFASDGLTHTVEMQFHNYEGTGAYRVYTYIDGELLSGYTSIGSSPFQATSNQLVDIGVKNADTLSDSYKVRCRISNIVITDSVDDSIKLAEINSIFPRLKYRSTSDQRDLRTYVASNRYLWANDQISNVWAPIKKLPFTDTTHADFRDSVILANYGAGRETKLYQIDRNYEISELNDAPYIRFMTTRNNRLFGAGDQLYPLRLYCSADRNPKVWFSPDTDADGEETYDEVLAAGFFEIDGESGDEIRAIWGEFLDSVIIATNRQLFRLTGNDFNDWRVDRISASVGAMGPHCIEQAGNDLWVVGENGIHSLKGVAEHGDVAASMQSNDIQEVFIDMGEYADEILPRLSGRTRLVHDPSSHKMLLYIPQADSDAHRIYSYNMDTGKWLGPEIGDYTTLETGIAGWPRRDAVLSGNSDGEVAMLFNYDDPDATVTVESQILTGRSVDPKLVGMEKVWRNFRLMCNPTGSWTVTLEFKAEDRDWQSYTKELCSSRTETIGNNWEVGGSEINGRDEVYFIDFPIDIKSRTLRWRLVFSGGKMSQLACEVEFTASGYERGD